MNIEHRTSNIERPTSNNVFYQFKIKREQHAAQAPAPPACKPSGLEAYGLEALHERIYPSKFDSAAFDKLRARAHRGESFDPELTTEGLVASCGSVFCGL
jgi:hypothetical protein